MFAATGLLSATTHTLLPLTLAACACAGLLTWPLVIFTITVHHTAEEHTQGWVGALWTWVLTGGAVAGAPIFGVGLACTITGLLGAAAATLLTAPRNHVHAGRVPSQPAAAPSGT